MKEICNGPLSSFMKEEQFLVSAMRTAKMLETIFSFASVSRAYYKTTQAWRWDNDSQLVYNIT